MNIAFDAKRAVQNNTGLGNYSRYVISVLSHFYPHNRYLLFSPGKKESARLQELKSKRNFDFILPKGIWKIFSGSWRTFGITSILKQKSIDIYHGLSQELPYGIKKTGVKSIVTIHDLIFVRYPGHYNLIEQFIHWWKIKKYRYASHQADKIIAVSECTKRDVVSFFKIHPDKIAVVYQGCHPVFSYPMSPEKKAAIIKKYRLPARFILYVGSIVTRKNLLLIVRSLLEVDQNVCLIAVKSLPISKRLKSLSNRTGYQTASLYITMFRSRIYPHFTISPAFLFFLPSMKDLEFRLLKHCHPGFRS